MDLLPKEPKRPGRKQTVTARAWIIRDKPGGPFVSCVSLGKGRTYKRATETRNRPKALAFNLAHLRELLLPRPKDQSAPPRQLYLTEQA